MTLPIQNNLHMFMYAKFGPFLYSTPVHNNGFTGRQHSFVEIYHEIFSTVFLSFPLIQEGQLLVSSERMCTILVSQLEN